MAELICTEEEKMAATYLEWDDAALGMAVKHLALTINDEFGGEAMRRAATALCCLTAQGSENCAAGSIELNGITDINEDGEKVDLGDWLITIQRVRQPLILPPGVGKA